MQVVAGLSKMQARRSDDERVKRELQKYYNRVMAMAAVHEQMYRPESLSAINLGMYVEEFSGGLLQMYAEGKQIDLESNLEEITLGIELAAPCGLARRY